MKICLVSKMWWYRFDCVVTLSLSCLICICVYMSMRVAEAKLFVMSHLPLCLCQCESPKQNSSAFVFVSMRVAEAKLWVLSYMNACDLWCVVLGFGRGRWFSELVMECVCLWIVLDVVCVLSVSKIYWWRAAWFPKCTDGDLHGFKQLLMEICYIFNLCECKQVGKRIVTPPPT